MIGWAYAAVGALVGLLWAREAARDEEDYFTVGGLALFVAALWPVTALGWLIGRTVR